MKLNPYPKYKDSGIQWIGGIPEDWKIERFKIRYKTKKGKIPDNLDELNDDGYLPYLSMEYLRGKEENVQFSNDPKALKVDDGDLLLLWDGSNAGEFIPSKKGYLSSTMVKLIIDRMDDKYSWFLCSAFEPMLKDLTIGMGIPHVNGDVLDNIRIPIIEIKEQRKMALLLNFKTSEINKTIEKDRQLIDLLKEKRTALINHVVTKGLDPKVKMKKVSLLTCNTTPEKWEIIRLKFASRLSRGVDLSNEEFEEGKFPVYGSNGIIGHHNKFTTIAPSLTVGRSGSVGEVNYVKEEKFWAHNTSLYLQDNYGNDVKYLFYLFLTLDLKHLAAGSAVGTLNRNYIHDLLIPLPPKPEQIQIVQYLDEATSKINQTIQKIEEKITLMEEYKKSLIHHVITGKVDVRAVNT